TPTPTATPVPTPTPKPKPKPTPAKTTNQPVTQTQQTPPKGTGPGGSMLRTGSNGVALTFDDGPDPDDTPRILDLLKRTGVKATFCLIGNKVAANAAVVRRIV